MLYLRAIEYVVDRVDAVHRARSERRLTDTERGDEVAQAPGDGGEVDESELPQASHIGRLISVQYGGLVAVAFQ